MKKIAKIARVATILAAAVAIYVATFSSVSAAKPPQVDTYFLLNANLDFTNATWTGNAGAAAAWHGGCAASNQIYQGASASRLTSYCEGIEFDPYTGSGSVVGAVWDIRITKRDNGPLDFGVLFKEATTTGQYESVELPYSGTLPESHRVCSDSIPEAERAAIGCDLIATRYYDLADFSMMGVTVRSASVRIYFDDVFYVVYGQDPATAPDPFDLTCDYSTTITGSVEITETINANLLINPSFEDGLAGWQEAGNLSTVGPASSYPDPARMATDGEYNLHAPASGYPSTICQGLSLPENVTGLRAGLDTIQDDYPGGSGDRAITLTWQTEVGGTVAHITYADIENGDLTWETDSGLQTLLPGNVGIFCMSYNVGQTGVFADRVYLHAEDAAGGLVCIPPEDAAPPTIPDLPDDTDPGPISPIPVGGAGVVCYLCTSPDSAAPNYVSLWVAWLGCVLRNLFSCSLRVWLYDLSNSLRSIVAILIGGVNWINLTASGWAYWLQGNVQAGIDLSFTYYTRIAEFLSAAPRTIVVSVTVASGTVDAGTDWIGIIWEIIKFLFSIFIELVMMMVRALTAVLMLVVESIRAIDTALRAPAYEIDIFTGYGGAAGAASKAEQRSTMAAALLEDGPNDAKRYAFLLLAMAAGDSVMAMYDLWWLQVILMGMIGFMTMLWMFRQWRQIIPN